MREMKDENGRVWDIESAGIFAERHRDGEDQKLMHSQEGEWFIYAKGKTGPDGQSYEKIKPLSSDEAAHELKEKDWQQVS